MLDGYKASLELRNFYFNRDFRYPRHRPESGGNIQYRPALGSQPR